MNIPKKFKKADIVVGIPSYNEADNIDFVVRQIDKGISSYFPKKKGLIINVDNNSSDKTREAFLRTKTFASKAYISSKPGQRGKGYNFYNLFKIIRNFSCEINLVFDADLKSIEPIWIKKMADSLIKGYDFVCPFYARNKKDALITNHFCYPLIYALLGWDIGQPIGGDFGFSLQMVEHWLSKKWQKSVYRYGVDIFMTTEAILNNFKICQVDLGSKIHKPSQLKLKSMFIEVALTLFSQLVVSKRFWGNRKIKKAKIFNRRVKQRPRLSGLDLQRFKDVYNLGFQANEGFLKMILMPENQQRLKEIAQSERVGINSDLWSRIIYDFIFAYERNFNKRKLMELLEIIAFGRFFYCLKSIEKLNFSKAEREMIKQAKIFRKNRSYLVNKYK